MTQEKFPETTLIDLERLNHALATLSKSFRESTPFPHIVIDDFLTAPAAKEMHNAFPDINGDGWTHYLHFNEKKHGLTKIELFPEAIQHIIQFLNGPAFLEWLSQLTGISDLLPDHSLEGGGLHQTKRGGFLNIHADFTVHPHNRFWKRRINLLIYLNPTWEEAYRGELELWSADMKTCEKRIAPLFNRCVIFQTDEDSYHGYPDALKCPEDETRKSIALYYFTEESSLPKKRITNYKSRPTDGIRAWGIWVDKKLLALYSHTKSLLGLNDDFISSLLKFINRKF